MKKNRSDKEVLEIMLKAQGLYIEMLQNKLSEKNQEIHWLRKWKFQNDKTEQSKNEHNA